jgi:hypothetical protein
VTGEVAVQSIWIIGAFVLVLSGLIARRLPLSDWMRMAAAWVGIFAFVFMIVKLWQNLSQ